MAANFPLPKLPRPDFPVKPHKNGQWYRSVWNSGAKKSVHYYFGTWADDPKGERALKDPQIGWLARKDAIYAGIDNVRVDMAPAGLTLGELMARFLTFKRDKVKAGELSLATLEGYLREIQRFVSFEKTGTPASGLRPEHFSAFMKHMVEVRKLGRFARKRVVTYINTFLRYGAKNGWITMPNAGVDWVAPATDPDSMRVARARAGVRDNSDRIVTGEEIDNLLRSGQPSFRAMVLLGINCGFGPADLGRIRWNMIDLESRRVKFPRPKTGTLRVGFLWKRTVHALHRVRRLKHNRIALARDGESSLVFITRNGEAYYRETEAYAEVEIVGVRVKKLVGVKVDTPLLRTFRRKAQALKLSGLTFYRLRHTFKTLGKRAKDREALNLMMGHRDASIGRIYDHEEVAWSRIKRVARAVYRGLWHPVKPKEGMQPRTVKMRLSGGAVGGKEVA